MAGYVYILERVTNRNLWAIVTFQHEIKIGISVTPVKRYEDINADVKGDVKLLRKYVFSNYRYVEKYLHDLFDDSNFNIGQGRKAGNTEWFYMSWLEMVTLYMHFWYIKHRWYIRLAMLIICTGLYFLIKMQIF